MTNVYNEKKKWRWIIIENYLQIFLLLSLCAIMIGVVWSFMDYSQTVLLPICIFHIIIFMPLLFFKLKFRIRIYNYLKVIEKGDKDIAQLELIENANIIGDRWLGYTHRYIFHFKCFVNGCWSHRKYTVVCTSVDSNVLGLKKNNNQYTFSDSISIPIRKNKKKIVVLQNECGFYDLVHDNSEMRTISHYW